MALQGHVELEKLAYLHTHFIPVEQDKRGQIEISAEEQVSLFLKSNRTDGRLGATPRCSNFLDHGHFLLLSLIFHLFLRYLPRYTGISL